MKTPKTRDMSPRAKKEVDVSTYEGRFAVRLKKLREKKKVSIEALSEMTGIPQTTLYRWENGDRCPVNAQVLLVAEALEIKISRLLEDPKK